MAPHLLLDRSAPSSENLRRPVREKKSPLPILQLIKDRAAPQRRGSRSLGRSAACLGVWLTRQAAPRRSSGSSPPGNEASNLILHSRDFDFTTRTVDYQSTPAVASFSLRGKSATMSARCAGIPAEKRRWRTARSRPPPDRGVSERALSLLITGHGAERRDQQQRKSHVRSRTAEGGSHPLRT